MKLIYNLQEINRLAKLKEEGNWKFRVYLKGQSSSKIDRIIYRLNKEISDKIDCTKCGNCCKSQHPVFDSEDITIFSKGLHIDEGKFVEEFLCVSTGYESGFVFINENEPCPFLEDKKCSNYEFRPKDCQSYPHLHKKAFISRTIGIINNTFVCPIVFNVVETLKDELKFQ